MTQTTDFDQLLKSLTKKLAAAQYAVSPAAQEQLIHYLQLLIQWNQAYNLTSVRDPQEMITRHILDSLSISPYLQGQRILDVGTGAGLPGIPLALTQPQREFVLNDSNGKKTRFLTQVVLTLKIPNVTISQARVEQLPSTPCFDSIVSRAFSSIAEFVNLTQHLCCENGCWLAMKGENPTKEIAELDDQFSTIVYDLTVKGLDAKRHLVSIKRQHQTTRP